MDLNSLAVLFLLYSTAVPLVNGLKCYWCSYSLTAQGELGASCKDEPASTGRSYTCPTNDDQCALYVQKEGGVIVDLRRYCSINCQTTCSEEDYETDFENMDDGTCYRCCTDKYNCNGRWEEENASNKEQSATILTIVSVAIATLLNR
ncbi:uncharacterized protein LOC144434337 [Glandiceps talaboti]